MAASFRLQKVPQCLGCLRSIIEPGRPSILSLLNIQIRGKKTGRKLPPRVTVKLLRDIPGYGRKGVVMAVAPGRMRNFWYPKHMAQYMTAAQLAESNETVVERDPTFGSKAKVLQDSIEITEAPVQVKLKLLSPEQSRDLLEKIVPESLEFYRTPIAQNRDDSSGLEDHEETLSQPSTANEPHSSAIYGSVSSMDIVTRIKELAATNAGKEGFEGVSRLVVSAEDIRIVATKEKKAGVEMDRVKALGDFEFDILIKGGDAIRRKLKVNLQA